MEIRTKGNGLPNGKGVLNRGIRNADEGVYED